MHLGSIKENYGRSKGLTKLQLAIQRKHHQLEICYDRQMQK